MRAILAIFLLTVFWFTVPATHGHAYPPELVLNSPDHKLSIDGHIDMLRDPGGKASFADVSSGALDNRFRPLAGGVDLGFTKSVIWLRWRVKRTENVPDSWLLDISPPFLDDIQLYIPRTSAPSGPSDYRLAIFGDHHPLSSRPVVFNRFLVPYTPTTESQTLYARVTTTSAMIFHGTFETPQTLIRCSVPEFLARGLFFGVTSVVVILNLIYWLLLRARVYLSCAIYGSVSIVTYFSIDGFVPIFLFPEHPLAMDILVGGGICAGLTAGAMFAYDALEMNLDMSWSGRVMTGAGTLGLVGIGFVVTGHYQDIGAIIQISAVIFTFYVCVIAAILTWRGRPSARVFLAAFGAQLIGLAATVLRTVGILPSTFLTDYAYQITFLITITLANVGIAQRLKKSEEEREQAQHETLMASLHSEERAIRRVEERTRELAMAKARAERALHAERQAVSQQIGLADMLAHEYRTPLSTIRGNLDILRMLGTTEDIAAAALSRMEAATARLTDIIELAVRDRGASLWAGRVERDLRLTVTEAVAAALEAHAGRGITSALSDGPVILIQDERLLRIAIANIVENALKFSDAGSPVSVELRLEDGKAILDISDKGIGIPSEEIGRVFERYYRSTANGGREGTGIGLYLAATIVEAHEGSIQIVSVAQSGTKVTVILPLPETGGAVETQAAAVE